MVIKGRVNPRLKTLSQALELNGADMKAITVAIDSRFINQEKRQFASQGTSGGSKWAALSPEYAKWKKKRFGSKKIMQRTGKLRKGLTTKGHPDHIARWFKGFKTYKVVVGTANPVAALHGAGGGGMKGASLPKRDVMQYTQKQYSGYIKLIRDYLIEHKLKRVVRAMQAAAKAGLKVT